MKKIMLLATLGILFLSCSKEESEDDVYFATTPETTAENDGSAWGVYKGVLLGTEGSIKVTIYNGSSMAHIFIYEKGVLKDELSTTSEFTQGQPIVNAHFESENSSMDFSVNADGTNPVLENVMVSSGKTQINVDGYLVRETSDRQVLCYEGNYGGDDQGIFKCMINGTQLVGYTLSKLTNEQYSANAPVFDNSFSAVFGDISSGATFQGSFTLFNCSGGWSNTGENEAGGFGGKRSL